MECVGCNGAEGTAHSLLLEDAQEPTRIEITLCEGCATEILAEDWISAIE